MAPLYLRKIKRNGQNKAHLVIKLLNSCMKCNLNKARWLIGIKQAMKLHKLKLPRTKLMKLFNWLGHSGTRRNLRDKVINPEINFMQDMQNYVGTSCNKEMQSAAIFT